MRYEMIPSARPTRRAVLAGGALAAGATLTTPRLAAAHPAASRWLIRGGYLLTLDPALGELPVGDVLLDRGTIVKVAPRVSAAGARVIDASGMLVMPGLVDNHRHLWQGLLRGDATRLSFADYFGVVLTGALGRCRPDDIYLGALMAAYDALDSGVTTVLDWAHGNRSHEHALANIAALRRAGIRGVFAYGSPANDRAADAHPTADEVRDAHRRLAGEPLLDLAVALRNPETGANPGDPNPGNAPNMPRIRADLALARDLGVRSTMHVGTVQTAPYAPSLLDRAGLLAADLTFIHANPYGEGEWRLIADCGAAVSSAPEVERQMFTPPASPIAAMVRAGLQPTLSTDTVAIKPGDLWSQMRHVQSPPPVRSMLPWVTTNPAASLGLADRVGTLTPGKEADLILIDLTAPTLAAAADPVSVLDWVHPGVVDTVMVAGRLVKHRGVLNIPDDLGQLSARAAAARPRILAH